MRFEKKRNAELMVTQRKEALEVRKQEERVSVLLKLRGSEIFST